MNVKVKAQNQEGIVRLEGKGEIMEVFVNEDILNPDKEQISVCFRGKDSSGIIEFTPDEFERLANTLKDKLHLVRGFKQLSRSGAIKF